MGKINLPKHHKMGDFKNRKMQGPDPNSTVVNGNVPFDVRGFWIRSKMGDELSSLLSGRI